MAIDTPTLLDHGLGTTADPSVTDSNITPTTGALVLVSIQVAFGTTVIGVTGCGLTWTLVDSQALTLGVHYVFAAPATAPTNGKLSFDLNAVGSSSYEIVEFASGGTVIQSAKAHIASGTALACTLAAFSSADNGVLAFAVSTNNVTYTPGSGFTELSDHNDGLGGHAIEYRLDNDTSVDMTTSASCDATIIAMEIAALTAAFTPHGTIV